MFKPINHKGHEEHEGSPRKITEALCTFVPLGVLCGEGFVQTNHSLT
jgi:hypothetical protein